MKKKTLTEVEKSLEHIYSFISGKTLLSSTERQEVVESLRKSWNSRVGSIFDSESVFLYACMKFME